MADDNQIFRKVALDRLSSPEQLDQLMQVTSAKGWLAILALCLVLALAFLWGIFGSIHTKLTGRGILLKGGSVLDTVAVGSGVVTQILVKAGDVIHTNQLVAIVSQAELQVRLDNTISLLAELRQQHTNLVASEQRTLRIELDAMAQEATNLLGSVANYDQLLAKLNEKLTRQKEALASGLIIPANLLATEIEVFNVEQDQARARQRLLQLEATKISRPAEIQQWQASRLERIEEMVHTRRLIEEQLRLTSEVRSSHEGTVLEVIVDPGSFVTAGSRILSLETPAQLEAVIFTASDQGKRIKPDFQVQLSPATVKREEAGFIRGKVALVSSFPSTPERMMRVVRNQDLVRQLSGAGAPIEVLVTLQRNPQGGYVWSSSRRPPEISSGTLCEASFLVETNRPIAMVLPFLRQSLGL